MAPKMTPSLPYKLMGIFSLEVLLFCGMVVTLLRRVWYSQKQACSGTLLVYGHDTAFKMCRELGDSSFILFILVALAAGFLFLSLCALIRWCYASFASHRKVWYYAALGFLFVDASLLGVTIYFCLRGFAKIKKVAESKPPQEESPDLTGTLGWCFWLIALVLALHLLLFLFWFLWVPRGLRLDGANDFASYKKQKKTGAPPAKKQKRKTKGDEASKPLLADEDEEEKQVFWAFIPEPLQPMFGRNEHYFKETELLEEDFVYEQITTTYVGEPVVTTQYVPGGQV